MKKSWESVTIEVIVKSFRSCGISVNVDGSEDGEIHCIKENGVAVAAKADISSSTSKLLAPQNVAKRKKTLLAILKMKKKMKMNWNKM